MLVFDLDNEFSRVFSFLKENDDEFIPSLSSRVDVEKYAKKLAYYGHNIFVRSDDVDVAHAGFYVNDKKSGIAYLSSICVAKKQRGSNVAAQLLERVMICAASEGMVGLQLEVCGSNNRAIAFYQKHDFENSSRKNGVNLIMKTALNGSK